MLKSSHTDIVLHASAFRAHIQQRQMRHILAFLQVTFAETCCLAGNCIGLVYPYAEPISPRSDSSEEGEPVVYTKSQISELIKELKKYVK